MPEQSMVVSVQNGPHEPQGSQRSRRMPEQSIVVSVPNEPHEPQSSQRPQRLSGQSVEDSLPSVPSIFQRAIMRTFCRPSRMLRYYILQSLRLLRALR